MAIAVSQTTTGTGTSVASVSLTSWTPASNELVLLAVATRSTVSVSSVAGNGLTWVNVLDIQDGQNQCRLSVWRAMGASPSAGQITATLSGTATAVAAEATCFSGIDTGGTNGSAAVEASVSANQGATDTTTPTVSLTTVTANAWAVGFITHRQRTLTVGSGYTAISINNAAGSAGDITSVSVEQLAVVTPAATTVDATLNATSDWVVIALSIKPAITSSQVDTTATAAASFQTSPDTTATAGASFQTSPDTTATAAATFGKTVDVEATAAASFNSQPETTATAAASFQTSPDTTTTAAATFGKTVDVEATTAASFAIVADTEATARASFQTSPDTTATAASSWRTLYSDTTATAASSWSATTSPITVATAAASFSLADSQATTFYSAVESYESHYELRLVHPNGYYVRIVDDYLSLEYTMALNEIGEMTLVLPGDHVLSNYPKNARFEIWRSVGNGPLKLEGNTQWRIQRRTRTTDEAGNRTYTIMAKDLKSLPECRIVAYNHGDLTFGESLGDYADDIMKLVVRQNLGALASNTARSLASVLTVADDLSAGAFIAAEYAHENVFDTLKKLADSSYQNGTPVYFDVIVNGSPNELLFTTATVCPGTDRRTSAGSTLVIGYDQGTLGAHEVVEDYTEEITYVYAGGPGEDDMRLTSFQEDTDRSGDSIFGLREVWLDFQEADTQEKLDAEALGALHAGRPRKMLVGSILNVPGCLYGLHWGLGDYLTASADEETFDCLVTAVHVSLQANGQEAIDAGLRSD